MSDRILFGAAYYDEYMPYERLEEDMAMMKKAHINTIRIAESTWATEEREDGVFDFTHVTRVLEAASRHGIGVIIGTPTYAVPSWLVRKYPEIMVMDPATGLRRPYGARQIMDITNKDYRFYARRIIRALMEAVSPYECVIGYQLDNETKHYGTCSENVQLLFREYLKKRFDGDVERLNRAFGFDYWSNRIAGWEDLPSAVGTINGSFGCAFEAFQRSLVTEWISEQRAIVDEFRKSWQFVTHNFDFEWRGYSYGVQPDVEHREVARSLTITGCDIYHPTQDSLTGIEIAMMGALARSYKHSNYYVLETECQGFPYWTPYPGQLRLQAYSHIAAGAESVMYWHWHSLHNAIETYWKGVLSHNLKENEPYREVKVLGAELERLSPELVHLRKQCSVAILADNSSLTAMKWFRMAPWREGSPDYNDVLRRFYEPLLSLNVEADFVWAEDDFSPYKVLIVPLLYSASDALLEKLRRFTEEGGTLIMTFKSGFTDENVKVRNLDQPGGLTELFGLTYDQFTIPEKVTLEGDGFSLGSVERAAEGFMEFVIPSTASVISRYGHPVWSRYAAVTCNSYGKGRAYYVATLPTAAYVKELYRLILPASGVELISSPVSIRKGVNERGESVTFYLNYSSEEKHARCICAGRELFSGRNVYLDDEMLIPAWNLAITISRKGDENGY